MGSEKLSGRPESLPHQSQKDHIEWQPKRLGYGRRQWSHRPISELESELYRESYRSRQPFEPTVMDLRREGKAPLDYLSNNGLKLLKILALGDRNMEVLCWYAEEDKFDLKVALDELREHELLDNDNTDMVGLVKKRM